MRRLSAFALRRCGGLMAHTAGGAGAAIAAAAGFAALFIPPQDKPSRGGEEDENEDNEDRGHDFTLSP